MGNSLALNDFLGHTTKTGGGKTGFLRGWRKRTPPAVTVFLHRKSPIVALWQHNVPHIYEQKDEGGSVTRRVFGGSWNCLESEAVLTKQYRRDRDTGERLVPPVVCPICRMMEALRDLYEQGAIGFADSLFRWEGDDPQETQVLSYGGILNQYGSDRLDDTEKAAMAKARISLKEAWKENLFAKCNYLFVVADADDPETGIQVAVETTSLGDHVKECIRNQMVSLGEEDGNPILNPYALRWEHNAKAAEFSKKYKCIAMPKVVLTTELAELIDGDPPDISGITRPGNITTLRADLEAHWVGKVGLDWDAIFGPAEAAGFGQAHEGEEAPEEAPAAPAVAPRAAPRAQAPAAAKAAPAAPQAAPQAPATPVGNTSVTEGRKRKPAAPEPAPEPAPNLQETIPCDECGHPMLKVDTTCAQCGAEYEMDASDAPAAPPKAAPVQTTQTATPGKAGKKGIKF